MPVKKKSRTNFYGVLFSASNAASLHAGMAKEKLSTINVKVPPLTHAEFRIAAKLRGGTMSSLLHQYMVKVIREEKEREPEAFKKLLKKTA